MYGFLGCAPLGNTLALPVWLKARELDPLYLYGGANAGFVLSCMGRSSEGVSYLDEVLNIEPNFGAGMLWKSVLCCDMNRLEEAAALLVKAQGQFATGSMNSRSVLYAQYALALEKRDSPRADALLKQIMTRLEDPRTFSWEIDFGACTLLPFLVRHGQMDVAFQILKRNLEEGYFPLYDALIFDPRLEPLRREGRFKPILEKSRQDFEALMKVLEQARGNGEFPSFLESPFANLNKRLGIKL